VATIAILLAVATAAPLCAQSAPPTVAVLYFDNGAMLRRADYAPLSKGITDMLITALAANNAVRVVERDRLQQVLEEQNLQTTSAVDPETAVRLGKLLGAQHMITGGFVIDPRENIRISVRAINGETSEQEYSESVTGKAENVLELIDQLARKVDAGLQLPPPPPRNKPLVVAANQYKAVMLVSRAIEEQDRKNDSAAVALLRQALQTYPGYVQARVRLTMLEQRRP
jgi:curli biogenesis system outer membrane secretion channel CsgG